MESISTSSEVGGAGGGYSYNALKRLDNLLYNIFNKPQSEFLHKQMSVNVVMLRYCIALSNSDHYVIFLLLFMGCFSVHKNRQCVNTYCQDEGISLSLFF